MKKTTLFAILTLLAGHITSYAEDVAFSWDFSNGLEGFTLYDVDGREPNSSASQYGFKKGIAWQVIEYNKSNVAASNSTHSPIGPAEDWMITPAITVGTGQTLMFDICTNKYGSNVKIGNFKVLVSTTGTAMDDFTDVLTTKSTANSAWATVSYDLSKYAGKTIYVAIINISLSKDMLIVDNIFVGIPPVAYLNLKYDKLQANAATGQRITGVVKAGAATTITKYKATLTCGNFTTVREIEGLNIEPNASHTFQFNENLPAPTAGTPQSFTVKVRINDEVEIISEGEIATQAYQPTKRIVAEEATGTWCGWCIRGIATMENLKAKYPDTFIGIAVHSGDPMQLTDYLNALSPYIPSGYPAGTVMRQVAIDPGDFETYYNQYINTPAWADVSVYAEWTDETHTSIYTMTNTTFATTTNNMNARLILVLIENDVHGTTANYNQANYYAGGSAGAMSGYEMMPDPIPAAQMYYQEVARATWDSPSDGIANSIPKAVVQGEVNKYYRELTVPSNVFVPTNCEVIALLVNQDNGSILNAGKCEILPANSAVKATKGEPFASRAYRTEEGVRIIMDTPSVATMSVDVYATDGTLAYSAPRVKANGNTTIDCPVKGRGVYLVRIACGNNVKTHKVIL